MDPVTEKGAENAAGSWTFGSVTDDDAGDKRPAFCAITALMGALRPPAFPFVPRRMAAGEGRRRRRPFVQKHSSSNGGHFVRVTQHFTLHRTGGRPLRQDVRKHSFHFLTLKRRAPSVSSVSLPPPPQKKGKK